MSFDFQCVQSGAEERKEIFCVGHSFRATSSAPYLCTSLLAEVDTRFGGCGATTCANDAALKVSLI